MFGYDRKELELSHAAPTNVSFTVEVDFAADNTWSEYARFSVGPGQTLTHVFPDGYSAHWVRIKSDSSTTATATFTYAEARPQLSNPATPFPGTFQFTATGNPGQPYTVRASSDLNVSLENWPAVSTGTFGASPQLYQDSSAATNEQRYYIISVP
jgi:hypothetical protein